MIQFNVPVRIVLGLGGLVLLIAGVGTTLFPIEFSAKHDVILHSADLVLNDVRGSGGVMIGAALLMLLGAIHKGMSFTGALVGAFVYGFFALGRGVSFIADDTVSSGLIKATAVEAAFAIVFVFTLKFFATKAK